MKIEKTETVIVTRKCGVCAREYSYDTQDLSAQKMIKAPLVKLSCGDFFEVERPEGMWKANKFLCDKCAQFIAEGPQKLVEQQNDTYDLEKEIVGVSQKLNIAYPAVRWLSLFGFIFGLVALLNSFHIWSWL